MLSPSTSATGSSLFKTSAIQPSLHQRTFVHYICCSLLSYMKKSLSDTNRSWDWLTRETKRFKARSTAILKILCLLAQGKPPSRDVIKGVKVHCCSYFTDGSAPLRHLSKNDRLAVTVFTVILFSRTISMGRKMKALYEQNRIFNSLLHLPRTRTHSPAKSPAH
jgi:hypothetical protein